MDDIFWFMTLLICKDFKLAIKKDIMDIILKDQNKPSNKPDDKFNIIQIFLKTSA